MHDWKVWELIDWLDANGWSAAPLLPNQRVKLLRLDVGVFM